MKTSMKENFTIGSFKKYFIIVLSIVAILILKQFIVDYQISGDLNQSKIINVAGRQRMLSQRIAKDVFALSIYYNDSQKRSMYLNELKNSLATWQKSSEDLISQNSQAGLSGNYSDDIQKLYLEIEANQRAMQNAAEEVIRIAEKTGFDKNALLDQLKIIEENESQFLDGMNNVVNQYEFESRQKIVLLRNIEWILLIVLLTVIVVETLLIFVPNEKKLVKAFQDLDKSRNNFLKLFEVAPTAILLLDDKYRVKLLNSQAKILFKDRKSDIVDMKELFNMEPGKADEILQKMSAADKLEGLEVSLHLNGDERMVGLLSSTKVEFHDQSSFIVGLSDITKQKESEESFKVLANTDKLTNLYNRHYFDKKIEDEIKKADIGNEPVSLISFDIDLFKRVNDTFGHQTGDEVLKQVADTSGSAIRNSDIIARVGGEEFAILLPNTHLKDARTVAEKLRIKIENSIHPIAGVYTCSFGVSERKRFESRDKWFQRTDEALYKAKNEGRNRVVLSEP